MIVVDTNVIGYLYLAGPRSAQAERALLRDPLWAAPLLWRSEMRSVLAQYIRQSRIPLEEGLRLMAEAQRMMRGREYEVASLDVLRLAAESECSAYDCEFVVLARELSAALVTVDKQILRAFSTIAVSLDSFAGEAAV